METAPYDLIADLHHSLGHAVEIALVEHIKVTALVYEPLELIDEILRRSNTPVEALRAKRAARPATAATRDDRRELIVIVVSIQPQIAPLVLGKLDFVQVVHHRRRNEA